MKDIEISWPQYIDIEANPHILTGMKQLSDGTIVGKHHVYVPISGQPGKMRVYPSCGWDLDENGLPPMPREEKLMKDELTKNYLGRFYFNNEHELYLSQVFMSLSDEDKKKICEKAASAPARGEIPSVVMEREIKKKFYERRNKTMSSYTDYTKPCDLDFFCMLNRSDETPTVTGVEFGKEAVYLRVLGDKCQIYPKDETAKREVKLVRDLDPQEFKKTYEEKTGKKLPGGKFNRLQKALAKWRRMLTPFSTKQFNGPAFNKIVFSGRATILLGDKDKTIVKCQDSESYDPEKALLTALFIREYGKNTYHDLMEICHEEYKKCGGTEHSPQPFGTYFVRGVARSAADIRQAFADFTKKTD